MRESRLNRNEDPPINVRSEGMLHTSESLCIGALRNAAQYGMNVIMMALRTDGVALLVGRLLWCTPHSLRENWQTIERRKIDDALFLDIFHPFFADQPRIPDEFIVNIVEALAVHGFHREVIRQRIALMDIPEGSSHTLDKYTAVFLPFLVRYMNVGDSDEMMNAYEMTRLLALEEMIHTSRKHIRPDIRYILVTAHIRIMAFFFQLARSGNATGISESISAKMYSSTFLSHFGAIIDAYNAIPPEDSTPFNPDPLLRAVDYASFCRRSGLSKYRLGRSYWDDYRVKRLVFKLKLDPVKVGAIAYIMTEKNGVFPMRWFRDCVNQICDIFDDDENNVYGPMRSEGTSSIANYARTGLLSVHAPSTLHEIELTVMKEDNPYTFEDDVEN